MPVHRGNINDVILSAWNDALHSLVKGNDRGDTNRARSGKWIDSFARRFEHHYPGERYRLFWSSNSGNREQFGVNEFLFDLAVCSVSETKSLQIKVRDLPFIARCHRQIESEFSRANTRDIIVDMSKLVMGSGHDLPRTAQLLNHRRRARTDAASLAHQAAGQSRPAQRRHPGIRRRLDDRPASRARS